MYYSWSKKVIYLRLEVDLSYTPPHMKKKILMIDDESIFHYLNSKMIALSGIDCEVQSANNGAEALTLLKTFEPDFIFIDLFMPLMDGFEFVRQFQKSDFQNKEKATLIIMTSSTDAGDVEKASSLGIAHFTSKPLTVEGVKELLTKV
jgi:CheY-like chemotaxis protein